MRRHSVKKLWVVVVLLLVGSLSLDAPGAAILQVDGGSAATDCEEWNTEEFFQTATVEQVTACLAAGADVHMRGEYGLTPLHFAAAFSENPTVIETLLAAGADVNMRGEYGLTPLHAAAENNENPAMIEALLAAGADVAARLELLGSTPLHEAARGNENPAVIEALLAAGADVNMRDELLGSTPLHAAASSNENPAVVEALLAAGANAAVNNAAGQTPWDLAQENEALKGSDTYRRLNDARRAPGGGSAGGPAGTVDTGAGGGQ